MTWSIFLKINHGVELAFNHDSVINSLQFFLGQKKTKTGMFFLENARNDSFSYSYFIPKINILDLYYRFWPYIF